MSPKHYQSNSKPQKYIWYFICWLQAYYHLLRAAAHVQAHLCWTFIFSQNAYIVSEIKPITSTIQHIYNCQIKCWPPLHVYSHQDEKRCMPSMHHCHQNVYQCVAQTVHNIPSHTQSTMPQKSYFLFRVFDSRYKRTNNKQTA